MDPQSVQFAMEQMKRMGPEQWQQLAQQMNHLSPDTLQTAMAQMQSMKPEDWEQARHKINSMRPDELTSAASQATSHYQAQQEYIVQASIQLKNEGNRLHQQSQYAEAVPKYEKALSNLADFKSGPALDVVKACCLNLGSCFLQLGQYQECVEKCNMVLAGEDSNLKALYRRGQAYLKLNRAKLAVEDLQRAVKLSGHDPAQQGLIKAKLQEAKDLAWQQRLDGREEENDEEDDKREDTGASTAASSPPITIERTPSLESSSTTVAMDVTQQSASQSTSKPLAPFPSMPPGLDPSMLNQAVQMMRSNPDLMKQVEQQMDQMTPDQMAAMSAQMGMPVTKEMLSSAKSHLNNISPDELEAVAKIAASGAGSSANGTPPPMNAAAAMQPENLKRVADMVASHPDMMRQASEMISSMSPEQLAEMAKATGTPVEMAKVAAEQMKALKPEQLQQMARLASGQAASSSAPQSRPSGAALPTSWANGVETIPRSAPSSALSSEAPFIPDLSNMPAMDGPGGMNITPEMAGMVSKMMANMTPEQMAEMSQAAMSMAPMFQGGVARGAGGPAGMPDISPEMVAQLSRPEMMDQIMGMMRSMDKGTLVQMLMSNGMCKDEQQAAQMAEQMQSMSDGQMKLMVRAASTVQRTLQAAQSTQRYLMRNKLLLAALLVLLLAVLLRLGGLM